MTAITGSDGLVWESDDQDAGIKPDCFAAPKETPLKEELPELIGHNRKTNSKLTFLSKIAWHLH